MLVNLQMNKRNYNYILNFDKIKETRIKKGYTQKEVAKILNIKPSNLSRYENSLEIIPINKFNDICNFLESSFDYILGLSNVNNFKFKKELSAILVGIRLKEVRVRYKLYQDTLAKEIGTSKSLICEYEKGKKLLSLPYAFTICKKYNISMDWLYDPN